MLHPGAGLIAAAVILPGLRLPAVPMPGSWLGAAGIGLASAAFALAWARLRRMSFPLARLPWVIWWCVAARGFFDGFLRWKALVAESDFPFDPSLARIDAWLHRGPAWRLLPDDDGFLRAVDAAYYLWFPVLTGGILWAAWRSDADWRRHFVLAFVLVWVGLGICAAHGLASAGPIFTEETSLPAGLRTVLVRDALWRAFEAGAPTSISAMPSLHVAIPALYAVAARSTLRALFAAYTIVVLLGSVALRWHYAIDGYAAIAGVALCWWLASVATSPSPASRMCAEGQSNPTGAPFSIVNRSPMARADRRGSEPEPPETKNPAPGCGAFACVDGR